MHHGCDHAAAAAFARYGVLLGAADFAAMVDDIVDALIGSRRAALLLCRQQPSGREIWLARVPDGPAVRLVYEPLSAMIVTILPPFWRMNTWLYAA